MFDWKDEELTDIIWGDAGENDDHIVPYPDRILEKTPNLTGGSTKKDSNQQTLNVSPVEQKKPAVISERVAELVNRSNYDIGDPAAGFGLKSWSDGPDPSSPNSGKADQESIVTAASNDIAERSKNGSFTDETSQFDKVSEVFDNLPEDGEPGDLDYGWANIGSFDDLDRIFSDNDPIFGDVSGGNADDLWSSSKDLTSSPLGLTILSADSSDSSLGALRTSTDGPEIKTEYMLDPSQLFIFGYEKLNNVASHAPLDVQPYDVDGKIEAHNKQLNDRAAANLNEFPEKGNKQKRVLKGKRLDKKSEVRQLHDLSGTWSPPRSQLQHVNSQYAPSMVNSCPPVVLTHQRPLLRPEPLQQRHFYGTYLTHPFYGNVVNGYPPASVLVQFHPGEGSHELVSSGYEVPQGNTNSLKKSVGDPVLKPPAMTPKEKIEKLRRHQQMRAMLAIQKQQQQFTNQALVPEHSSTEGGNLEVDETLGGLLSLEPNSPIERDDTNTISMAFDNCSVEESVLYQLQDTIAKLDVQIRLCIRDSLYRLAQSAMQRQYPNDTSSANTSSGEDVLSNKDIVNHERFTRMPDVETDTNPIDRTVAHLLFHRPLEFSGKSAETPELPVSARLPYETKANPLKCSAKGYLPESSGNTQISQGSRNRGTYFEGDQSKNSPCFVTSERPSNSENVDGKLAKVEASA